ncbi:phage minor head protein [uncultured Methanobrevibacter sp.]|uniref:phage head morphogenesis protein n=1 Tax=uncultured Methanobrevibacter sp. TaxID=253161 RepID=UPI0026279828
MKGWESRRIARTEINSPQNEGAFSVYDELGVEYHMWWTGQDNRVRDSHAPLHGHIVAVGNTFSNGLLFPGDKSGPIKEWINCRCTTLPYIIPLGKMAPLGLPEFTEDQLIDIPGYRPITVEDALNGEYPLEYYQSEGVIDQYRMESPYRQLKNAITDELKGFIPDEDIELISSELAKHKLQTDKLRFETMSAWDSEGKQVLNNYTDYMDTRILHNPVEDIFEEKGFKLSIHNHPQGHSPIPSSIDVNKMLKTEYGLTSTTDNGLIVMKLEKRDVTDNISLRNSMIDFNNILRREFLDAESEYYNRIQKAYQSKKITKQEKGLALNGRYQKFLVKNVESYSKELDKKLSHHGIRVKYISKDNLPKIDNYKQKQKYTILDNENKPFKEAYGTPRFEDNLSEDSKFKRLSKSGEELSKAQNVNTSKTDINLNELLEIPDSKRLREVGKKLSKRQRKQYQNHLVDLKRKVSEYKTSNPTKQKELEKDILKLKSKMEKLESSGLREQNRLNLKKYKVEESSFEADDSNNFESVSEKGKLEKRQIASQQSIQISEKEIESANCYYGIHSIDIKGYFLNDVDFRERYWSKSKTGRKEYIKQIKEWVKNINSLMEKSGGLTQDTVLWSGREEEIFLDLEPGSIAQWKHPVSTSYKKSVGDNFQYDDRYLVKILAPKGTKGIAANDPRLAGLTREHEFTLPRNQKFMVKEIDHTKKYVTILLID